MSTQENGILKNHERLARALAKAAAVGKSLGNAFFVVNLLALITVGMLGHLDLITQSLFASAFVHQWYFMLPILLLGAAFFIGLVAISWGMEAKTFEHMLIHGWKSKPLHKMPTARGKKALAKALTKAILSSLAKAMTVGYGTFLTLEILLGGTHIGLLMALSLVAGIVVFMQAMGKEGYHYVFEHATTKPPKFSHWRQWLLGYPFAIAAAVAKSLGYGWGMMCLIGVLQTGAVPSMLSLSAQSYFHIVLFLLMACIATSVLGMEGRGVIRRVSGKIDDQAERYRHKVLHQRVRFLISGTFWTAALMGCMFYLPGLTLALQIDLAVVVGVVAMLACIGRFLGHCYVDNKAVDLKSERSGQIKPWMAWVSRSVSLITSICKGAAFGIGAFKIGTFIFLPAAAAIPLATVVALLVLSLPMCKERLSLERQMTGAAPCYMKQGEAPVPVAAPASVPASDPVAAPAQAAP